MFISSSTLTFPKSILSEYFAANFSMTGSIVLHGPHQTAQKSTNIGRSELLRASKFASVSLTVESDLVCSISKSFPDVSRCVFKIGVASGQSEMGDRLLARITKNLVSHEPPQKGLRFAAVSIVIRDRQNPSVLLIKRAERAGDPWSGQIAFPGGKATTEDRSMRETAVRETMEEVGIDLDTAAEFMGYGSVTTTHTGTIDVVPSVFVLNRGVDVRPNAEVASFRWVELDDFMLPASQSKYPIGYGEKEVTMPAYKVGDYVVWGLTYRMISSMLGSSG